LVRKSFFLFLALVCIVEKIIFILTLGYFNPYFEMRLLSYYAKRRIQKLRPEETLEMEKDIRGQI
tara:strand:+ start:2170 stop:2364 length:195 start_codon:yes stop_codon:yes gene_type:complete